MKVKKFIELLQNNLDADAEIDFLAIDTHSCEGGYIWLDPITVGMDKNIDFPYDKLRGRVKFITQRADE